MEHSAGARVPPPAPTWSSPTFTDRCWIRPRRSTERGDCLRLLDAAGECWTFGLNPVKLHAFLAERGLLLAEDVGATEYRGRYFGRTGARMRGYEFYRIAVANVPGGARGGGRS